jgi:hypothetical protein
MTLGRSGLKHDPEIWIAVGEICVTLPKAQIERLRARATARARRRKRRASAHKAGKPQNVRFSGGILAEKRASRRTGYFCFPEFDA